MIGEKHLETKIEDNKKIEIYEFKEFEYDYEQIAIFFNDNVNDDPEDLYSKGIYLDYDSYYMLDADQVLESVLELIDEWKKENEEGEEYNLEELESFVRPLENASGFMIYFNRGKDAYKDWKRDTK